MKTFLKILFALTLFHATIAEAEIFYFREYRANIHEPSVRAKNSPWVWIMPAWLIDVGVYDTIIRKLNERGIVVIGVEIGVTFGSPFAVEFNKEFYDYVVKEYKLNRKTTLLLQSNGALTGIAYATTHRKTVKRIGMIFPVLNLNSWPEKDFIVGDKDMINPSWKYAYAWPEVLSNFDLVQPLKTLKNITKRVPILSIHGDNDVVVPYSENTARAKGIKKIKVSNLGHEIHPAFHENVRMINFLGK